jgi:hypothetical protein
MAAQPLGCFRVLDDVVLLTLLWIISLRGDPPPSLKSLAAVNTVFFVVVETWAFWMNRNRTEIETIVRTSG